jgi:hypothetical protein
MTKKNSSTKSSDSATKSNANDSLFSFVGEPNPINEPKVEASPDPTDVPPGRSSNKPVLLLPGGRIEPEPCAETCFQHLAHLEKVFLWQKEICEFVGTDIEKIGTDRFRAIVSKYFTTYGMTADGLRPKLIPDSTARLLLKTDARFYLPKIETIYDTPILMEEAGALVLLHPGYNPLQGGVYVTRERPLRFDIPLEEAAAAIKEMFSEVLWKSPADFSRAIAALVFPSMRLGGILPVRGPANVYESEQSQSGKSVLVRYNLLTYQDRSYKCRVPKEFQLGSLEESIGTGLLRGANFISLPNIRGTIDCPWFEELIKGESDLMPIRTAYRGESQADVSKVLFFITSNSPKATRDLANRCSLIRIMKQPESHKFRHQGDAAIDQWLRETADYHLSCIYSIVAAWHQGGKPQTSDTRHDFVDWAQPLDWIVRNYFGLPPLLDGLREQLNRMSSRSQSVLRDILVAVEAGGMSGISISSSKILECCITQDVSICELPTDYIHQDSSKADPRLLEIGKILGALFKDARRLTLPQQPDADPKKDPPTTEVRFARLGDCQVVRWTRLKYQEKERKTINVFTYEFWFDKDLTKNGCVIDLWERYKEDLNPEKLDQ